MQRTTIWRKRTSPSSRVWAMRRWGLGELGEWAGSPSLSHTGLFVEQKRIRGEESFLDVSATQDEKMAEREQARLPGHQSIANAMSTRLFHRG